MDENKNLVIENNTLEDKNTENINSAVEVKAKKKTHYVGRITIGISLIAIGLIITLSLFLPQIEFLTIARLFPLVLVFLGIEILVGAYRHKGEQVKVGFGLTLLSLTLIFLSVGVAVVPPIWEKYGYTPEKIEQERQIIEHIKEKIYTSDNKSIVDMVSVGYGMRYIDAFTVNVDVSLINEYQDESKFADDVLLVLGAVSGEDIDRISIYSNGDKDSMEVSFSGRVDIENASKEKILKRIDHRKYIIDSDGNRETVNANDYESIMQRGKFIRDDELLEIKNESYQSGYDKGYTEAEKNTETEERVEVENSIEAE